MGVDHECRVRLFTSSQNNEGKSLIQRCSTEAHPHIWSFNVSIGTSKSTIYKPSSSRLLGMFGLVQAEKSDITEMSMNCMWKRSSVRMIQHGPDCMNPYGTVSKFDVSCKFHVLNS